MKRIAILGIALVALFLTVNNVFASGGTKVCVPAKEGKPIVTPKSGTCKTGYMLTELGAEGKEGPAGKEGPPGAEGKEGRKEAKRRVRKAKKARPGKEGKEGAAGKEGKEGVAGKEGKEGARGPGVKTIAGTVAASAAVESGTGFTITRVAANGYDINFPAGTWGGVHPIVTANGKEANQPAVVDVEYLSPEQVQLHTFVGGTAREDSFSFIAVEP